MQFLLLFLWGRKAKSWCVKSSHCPLLAVYEHYKDTTDGIFAEGFSPRAPELGHLGHPLEIVIEYVYELCALVSDDFHSEHFHFGMFGGFYTKTIYNVSSFPPREHNTCKKEMQTVFLRISDTFDAFFPQFRLQDPWRGMGWNRQLRRAVRSAERRGSRRSRPGDAAAEDLLAMNSRDLRSGWSSGGGDVM